MTSRLDVTPTVRHLASFRVSEVTSTPGCDPRVLVEIEAILTTYGLQLV